MSSVKKYILTAVTLGAIAMCAGALIGATDLITRDRIAANEANKINAGFAEIFGDGATGQEDENFEYSSYTYLKAKYTILDSSGTEIGSAYRTLGSNPYGKISLIICFTSDKAYKGLSVVINEQSFATTLEENYLTPLSKGEREIEDVKCGATYGATLVKDMINEAKGAVSPSEGEQNG